ncbi:DUF4440 domain-containing protein [Nocardia callitridis]
MSAHPFLTEIVAALHGDLAEWLATKAAPKVFDRFANALHPEFTSVTTLGQIIERDTLLAGVWAAKGAQPGLNIEVTEVEELASTETVVTVRFTAENQRDGASASRVVTAVLLVDEERYLWLSLHETACATMG